MLLLLTLLGCASVQVNMRGWTSYLQFAVVMTDEELAQMGNRSQSGNEHLTTIQWRLEQCRLRGWTCKTEVRVFRNRHGGRGHLKLDEIQAKLEAAGITSPVLTERLDVHPGGGDSCYVVTRVLRQD